MQYTPSSLELRVGQLVEMRPSASHLPGYRFFAAPTLPLGVAVDVLSGQVYGRPEEPTLGQVNYFVTAWNPAHPQMKMRQALIKLTVNKAAEVVHASEDCEARAAVCD